MTDNTDKRYSGPMVPVEPGQDYVITHGTVQDSDGNPHKFSAKWTRNEEHPDWQPWPIEVVYYDVPCECGLSDCNDCQPKGEDK